MKKLLLIISILVLTVLSAKADDPYNKFTYQGVLTNSDGTVVSDGTYDFVFKVFDVSTAGTALNTFTKTGISVSKGLFQVELGETGEFEGLDFITTPYYIEITVGSTTLSPRIEINPVGKSIISRNLKNGTVTNADITGSNIQNTPIGTTTPSTGKFTSLESGTLKITGGTLAAGKVLTSDASGNATWQSAGGGLESGLSIISSSSTAPSGFTATGGALLQDGTGEAESYLSSSGLNFSISKTFIFNDSLFIVGGYGTGDSSSHGTRQLILFDISANTFTTKQSMNYPRYYFSGTLYNGNYYVFGGRRGSNTNYDTALKSSEKYNIASNTWTYIAPLPNNKMYTASAELNGFIYISGGQKQSTYYDSVYKYNPTSNTYSPIKKMNFQRAGHGLVAYNGKLYAFGGTNGSTNLNNIEMYDPSNDTWTTLGITFSSTNWFFNYNIYNSKIYIWELNQVIDLSNNQITSVKGYDPFSSFAMISTEPYGSYFYGINETTVIVYRPPVYYYIHTKN